MKKQFYRRTLPHFQQPGQAYFITWSLKDAVPKKALKRYSDKLEKLRLQLKSFGVMNEGNSNKKKRSAEITSSKMRDSEISRPGLAELRNQYYSLRKKYIKAYDDLLHAQQHPSVNLTKKENMNIIRETLHFWDGKKLENYAYAIMSNHVHWVFSVFEKDDNDEPVFLQDILHSTKRFSGNRINKLENRTGPLWQKESFDTTIRDEKHLYHAIEYTLNNPVSAGLVKNWKYWPGCWFPDPGTRGL